MCDPANAGWQGAAITAGSSQCHLSDHNLGIVMQCWCLSSTWIVLRFEFRWQSFECLSGTFWLLDANTCSGEFLLQFEKIKATSSASVCHGCMTESWKNGLEITTVVVKTRGGYVSAFFVFLRLSQFPYWYPGFSLLHNWSEQSQGLLHNRNCWSHLTPECEVLACRDEVVWG